MFGIFEVMAKVQQALALAQLLKPVLGGQGDIIDDVTDIAGKVLTGVKFGVNSYGTLVSELDGVIAEMEVIKARGSVSGTDVRQEVALIRERGSKIDAIMARLKG